MKLNKTQQEDLTNKLKAVKEIIGFPINQKQKEHLEQIGYIFSELSSEQAKLEGYTTNSFGKEMKKSSLFRHVDLMNTSVDRAIALFEEYLA